MKQPRLGLEFLQYNLSKLAHGGQAIRTVNVDIKVSGFSGFGEFHSCAQCVGSAELRFLSECPQAPGVVIDVGANLGIVSVILARHFSDRQIYALEPNPSTCLALRENLILNGCSNVSTHALAAAGHDGTLIFEANPENRATTAIATSNSAYATSVECMTIDSFVRQRAGGEPIAFLKVDVEGYESLVFQGAADILGKRLAAIVYFEVCPALTVRAGFAPEAPARILQDYGYQLHRLDSHGRLAPADISDIPGISLDNWVAIRP